MSSSSFAVAFRLACAMPSISGSGASSRHEHHCFVLDGGLVSRERKKPPTDDVDWRLRQNLSGGPVPQTLSPPAVTSVPGVAHGMPSVDGVPVQQIFAQFVLTADVVAVATHFGLSRSQVMLAIWFAAHHGYGLNTRPGRNGRRLIRRWSVENIRLIVDGEWDRVPDPPRLWQQQKEDAA